ncbi:MAG: acyl carrier protein [Deltaproteobacteria bacterium]|nr:acyl carrier protein [Deltaproteobacteria bacterium]
MSATLKDDLRKLIAEITEIDDIPDGASFKDLGVDSMMALEIVSAIEREYKIRIEESELPSLTNLEQSFALVASKLAAKSS